MTSKAEFLDNIQTKHRQLERYLFYFEKDSDGVFVASSRPKFSREEMLQPGVADEWSLKDVLTHLIDRERRFVSWYEAGLRGEGLDASWSGSRWDDVDAVDQEIPAELEECSLEGILAEFKTSFQQILNTVQSISEEELLAPGYYARTGEAALADVIALNTWQRYDWAKKTIRRWRREHAGEYLNKQVVLERIRVERRRLENKLAELTADQMVEAGVVGEWSVKDVLAHLVDWEQRFKGWYEAGLRGEVPETPAPGLSWRDLDVLNQQIYEKHRARDLDAVMAEFDRSYEQVLAMVEGVAEEEMFQAGRYGWLGEENLVGYILVNTANHYRWAKTQIHRWIRDRNSRK